MNDTINNITDTQEDTTMNDTINNAQTNDFENEVDFDSNVDEYEDEYDEYDEDEDYDFYDDDYYSSYCPDDDYPRYLNYDRMSDNELENYLMFGDLPDDYHPSVYGYCDEYDYNSSCSTPNTVYYAYDDYDDDCPV